MAEQPTLRSMAGRAPTVPAAFPGVATRGPGSGIGTHPVWVPHPVQGSQIRSVPHAGRRHARPAAGREERGGATETEL